MHNPALVEPPRVGVLAGVTAWRLAIAACAFVGLGESIALAPRSWTALSQQASLLAGVVYLGLVVYPLAAGGRAHEPRSPWLRGATAVLLLLVCVTYLTVIGGSLDERESLLEHLVTPLLVLVDFVLVGRNQAHLRWWHPLTWLVFPAAYLVYYVAADLRLYRSFLDPGAGDFVGVVATFMVAIVAAGYVLYGVAKAVNALKARS